MGERGDFAISKPVENATLRVVSLGAGVQSTVMLLMAAHREIGPMPHCAIFADTQWEPAGVYEHLAWLQRELDRLTNGRLPIHTVTAGDIRADNVSGRNTTGQSFTSMPFYTANGEAMGRRQCTKEYKLEPIRQKVRSLLSVGKGQRVPAGLMVEQWIGLSTDEKFRLKDASEKWRVNRWPLFERRMNRGDCRGWFSRKYPGRPLVKSACKACPFQSNERWRVIRDSPADWADVRAFDEAIRHSGDIPQFVHRVGEPLADVDLHQPDTADLFLNECEGMCGT